MTVVHPAIPPMVTLACFMVTALAVWWAFEDEIRQLQHMPRRAIALVIAVVLAGVTVYADPPNGACMEATLRQFCGEWWWECGLALGCWLLPG